MNSTCLNRRTLWIGPLGAIVTAALVFCPIAPSLAQNGPTNADESIPVPPEVDANPAVGAVYSLTNAAKQNEVVIFNRTADGTLNEAGRVSTRGNGTGAPLDSTGAVILSEDNRWLYACNPGSDEISIFAVRSNGLQFVRKVYSGGDVPISLTIHGNLLYVLNSATSASNIFGFTIGSDGMLTPLKDSFRRLSTSVGVPAQVQFNPKGNVLVVTNKFTDTTFPINNIIDTFTIRADGLPSEPIANLSNGIRPFGFFFRRDGVIVVSESFNVRPGQSAASSYEVLEDGRLRLISGSVGNTQTDSCWVWITKDGRYAYTTNFISGTISSYRVGDDGSLSLLNAVAANTGNSSQPVDLDSSEDGQYLYVLLTGVGRVASFRVNSDGSLTPIDNDLGLPAMAGASGLVAR